VRGGARKGAGRKPGSTKPLTKALINFTLSNELIARLKAQVPRGRRSRFVQKAVASALSKALSKGDL